jgi:iron complex outermembrane receptor protein
MKTQRTRWRERSLEQKRASDSVADVVSAEDIGKLPDKNVADAGRTPIH